MVDLSKTPKPSSRSVRSRHLVMGLLPTGWRTKLVHVPHTIRVLWSAYGTDTPHGPEKTEPLASLTERHGVDDHQFRKRDDSTTTHSLNGTTDQDDSKVVGDSRDDRARKEECQTNVDQGFAAEDVGEGSKDGLEDSRGQEKRSACPKCFDG